MDLLNQHKEDSASVKGYSNTVELADYPSLAAAVSTKTKKKPQTLSLKEFTTYGGPKPMGLTPDELLVLPTGPRERSAEELDRNTLGGGFRSYGGGARDDQPRRQGNFSRDSNREFTPSRADEIDNWGAGKKLSVNNGFERRERRGFFEDSQSRADEVDNWSAKKSFVLPSEPRKNDKRGSFGTDSINGGADSDNWVIRKEDEGRKFGGSFDSLRERRGGFESNGSDSENWGRKREEVTNGGGGRPRLNLQPRTLPVGEGQKSDIGSLVKPKGSNPFGEARPREEVLKEKGHDWKEIEEKLDSTKTKDTAAMGSNDGPVIERKSFWNENGRERLQREDKIERAWRKPDSLDSRPSSADFRAENTSNEHTEDAEEIENPM